MRIYIETDDEGYVRFVNDLWARLPDEDVDMVLDSRTVVDRANADYERRYKTVPEWSTDDVAESEEEAQRLKASSARGQRASRRSNGN